MRDRDLALLAVLALGCAHKTPPEPAPPVQPAAPVTLHSPADVLPALLAGPPRGGLVHVGDPFARDLAPLTPAQIRSYAPKIAAWLADLYSWPQRDVGTKLQAGEPAWRGTPILALARGRRLQSAQALMSVPSEPGPEIAREVLVLVTALRAPAQVSSDLDRDPFAIFGPGDWRTRTLDTADAWILSAWLDGPAIDLGPVAATLEDPIYDRWRSEPLGALIHARATGAATPAPEAFAALERATALALERAAADRDAEQAAWKAHREAAATDVGDPRPITVLLARARDALTANAAEDRSAGGALLAIQAARWEGDCASACGGVERVDGLAAAARWDPDVARLARLWEVIALEEALDSFDVALEHPSWPDALVRLVDALIGTGAGPLPVTVVERSHPGPATWLDLGRALGVQSVDRDEVRQALGAHLAEVVDAALADPQPAAIRNLLERIRRRAG